MTYKELYDKALWDLDLGKINLGEFEDMIEPLNKEIRPMQVELEADGYADGELVYEYGKCPNCGWEFEEGDKDWEQPYCCHCGQKLKWFESEK